MEIVEKRKLHGYVEPEPKEIHGKVAGFIPAGDYVLIRRFESQEQVGNIVRPEAYIELAERGIVVALNVRARNCIDVPPEGSIAKFSKYGWQETHFDDEGQHRYGLVRTMDILGWHFAAEYLKKVQEQQAEIDLKMKSYENEQMMRKGPNAHH